MVNDMLLSHVGLVCTSEENADRFYTGLLGLEKKTPKILSAEISRGLFDVDSEMLIINYERKPLVFEIFIAGQKGATPNRIEHMCLTVDDLESFLARCRAMDVTIVQVPKGDKIISFVSDYDGNRFEITSR